MTSRAVAAFCLALAAACVADGAFASAGLAPAPGPVTAVGDLRDLFAEISASLDAFAAGNDGLVAMGRRTAVTLFGVLLVWGIVRSWVLGQGLAQLLPGFLQPVVVLGLALWAVDHLGPVVRASVDALGAVIAATMHLPAGPPTEVDIMERLATAAFEVASASPQSTGTDWTNISSVLTHQALGFLIRLATAGVLLLAGVVAAGVMMMAKVQAALGVLFAPVMIPWAMWPPASFLFNAWLGFLITGAMQGVMAAAVASLSLQVLDKVVRIATSLNGGDGVSIVTCCVLFLMGLLVAYLFTRVPSLASALVGGGAPLDLNRWSAVGQAGGRALSAAANGAAQVAKGVVRFGQGAAAGFNAGRHGAGRNGTGGGAAPAGGGGVGGGAGGGAPRGQGAAGLAGRGVGRAAGAASRAVSRPSAPAFPPSPAGGGAPGGSAPSVSPPPPPKPVHKPFRPKPGTRPVNRPLDRSG